MEQHPKLRWRAKMTLYRSVQSQPDLVKKPTEQADTSKLLSKKQKQQNGSHRRNRPHTAEATVRFQEMNLLNSHTRTRPNTAAVSSTQELNFADSKVSKGFTGAGVNPDANSRVPLANGQQ